MNSEEKQSLIKSVNEASPDRLRQFIINQAQYDPSFFQDVTAQFGELDTDAEFAKTKKLIQSTIRHNKTYGFIDYQGCIDVCNTLDDIINKYMLRFRQGHYQHALSGLLLVVTTCGRMLSTADSSSGALTDTFDRVFSAMKNLSTNIAPTLLDTQKDALVKEAIRTFKRKLFADWAEQRYKILYNVLPLITEKSAKLIQTASKNVIKSVEAGYDQVQSQIQDKILNARILIQLGQTDAAYEFMNENKDIPEIREVAIQNAIQNKDYPLAERLSLQASEKDPGWRRIWERYLIKIYDATDQQQKQQEVLEKRLFANYPDAFEPLKKLLKQTGQWNNERPRIMQLAAKHLTPENNAYVLDKEGQWDQLIQLVMQNPSLTETYSEHLYNSYPDMVSRIYYQNVILNDKNPSRQAYRRMGRRIKNYAEFGNPKTAIKWIDGLIEKYPTRPAMAEELGKVKDKLIKKGELH
ncbi:tetratricopeptide repeat protein [Lentilactobacillus parabuchneri]|jgi:hypothetical protein|uniref:Uncharacterized protein n=3 Tax=Lentilactobacillus parabuchneri TaxID=152331 RepID=A0A1X1FG10_9LACO|nr:hypothetical protein [Lentilactobacillus parabuchneri]APR07045.1 hypothetical protein FAM21731_00840 [Lentilactobacillus parabuchneri]KRM46110.1 hypothetical protein FC51_GL000559 [Lentilactobacillus parabuchneri DSM 5707 = NBRC 107865]KRN79624.1 hypothetical protein IV42_GL001201 [Lentilactobacillus parabuchneri]MBW0223206.1 hypothetical protein [Lentilactobacillus parabuchneri]MBW0246110.1 hypothetical protein [Lentilactobacillus parabuchneri]